MRVEWTQRARDRLGEIHDFIAQDVPLRARTFCEALIAAADGLARFPYRAPLLPEDSAYRQLVVAGYRVVYRVTAEVIYIATVVPPRQQVPSGELR